MIKFVTYWFIAIKVFSYYILPREFNFIKDHLFVKQKEWQWAKYSFKLLSCSYQLSLMPRKLWSTYARRHGTKSKQWTCPWHRISRLPAQTSYIQEALVQGPQSYFGLSAAESWRLLKGTSKSDRWTLVIQWTTVWMQC